MKKLHSELNKKRKVIMKGNPVYIYQKDFDEGTYLISEPGYYVLKENIVFNPNPNDDYMPRPDQVKYKSSGFNLGFFAVLAIYADGVYLDLNGYTIKASEAFSLQQRFFSIIELANSPFIPNQGPSDFSNPESFKAARNVMIRSGTLGRSSHHAIHGNNNSNVLLENLKVKDFENIGIALNGANDVIAHNLEIKDNFKEIPVMASYSASRFARMFAKRLLTYQLSPEQRSELNKRLAALETEMNQTFKEVMKTGHTKSKLFRNESGLPDGLVYGYLVKNKGVAVNDFVTSGEKVKNIFLREVDVSNLKCIVKEIVALSGKGGAGAQNDVAGAVFPIDEVTDKYGNYKGTLLSDLQLYLAELSLVLKIPLGKNNITQDVIDWSKNGNIQNLLNKGYKYKCNGDIMFHLCKNAIGYRFDAIDNLVLEKCSYNKIENYACLGNDKAAGHYKFSHDGSAVSGYTGSGTTGINISYCSNVDISKLKGDKLFSKNGDAIGINVIFNSKDVKLKKVTLNNIKAGNLYKGEWKGESYWNTYVEYTNTLPNKKPQSIGIRYENNAIVGLRDVCISDLHSCEKPVKILKV